MAFSFTKLYEDASGDLRMTAGTFTGTSVASGNIYTGLHKVVFIYLQPNNTASPAIQCNLSTTLPSADPIGIVMTTGVCGYWIAFGY
jgi:hypothetical protein